MSADAQGPHSDIDVLARIGRMTDAEREVLELVRAMLEAIHTGDSASYAAMCAEDVSCYETDVAPYRIDTLGFHLELIDTMHRKGVYDDLVRFDLLTPRVQVVGDAAIVTYTRLMTHGDDDGVRWRSFNETRVFAHGDRGWKMVHFHRSEAL